MRANVIIFALIGCFVTVVGVVYTLLTLNVDPGGIEWVGVPALFALAAMCWMIAIYVWMNERRYGGGAQDDENAEVHEEAGHKGVFAPYSWAPLVCAIGSSLAFGGFPIAYWISALGVVIGMIGVVMWVMAYSVGNNSH